MGWAVTDAFGTTFELLPKLAEKFKNSGKEPFFNESKP